MAIPRPATVDFETKGIERRPKYPPVPVGVSIQMPEQSRPKYYAWGHPTGNNCTKRDAEKALRAAWSVRDGILCHHAKFDYDVGVTHMGMRELPWHSIHDSMYLLFLNDPHAMSLQLKPQAKKLLGMEPEERDVVKDWILAHKREIEAKIGHTFKPSEWGAYICEAPGDLVGPYAGGDVVRALKLFRKVYPLVVAAGMLPAYDRERRSMPVLLQNEREGVRVDGGRLVEDIAKYESENERVEAWLRKALKVKELNLDSDVEVANALDSAGIVTEWNLTKTGKRSTSKKNMTPDMFSNWRIAAALGWRNRLQTCLGTFMRPWAAMAAETGHIYTNWNQVRNSDSGKGTRTGRLSTNPNFQNLAKDWYDKADGYVHPTQLRDLPELPLIRQYILPDKGQKFGRRDYNQQELRILAHFEDDKLLSLYLSNPRIDIHSHVQAEIERITGSHFERRAVKILNFGMLYGMGLGKLAESVGCSVDDARLLRNGQRAALPGVHALDKSIKEAARAGEPIKTWGGRLYYCEPPLIINGQKISFEYKLLNYLIQGSAADCTKEAVIRYNEARKHGRFLVTVHDEIAISAPAKAMKEEMAILREVMQSIEFDLPMISDGEVGSNWASLEKFKEKAYAA